MMSMLSDVTPDEARNGWTPEALRKYLAERDGAVNQAHRLGAHAGDPEPLVIITSHDPHNW